MKYTKEGPSVAVITPAPSHIGYYSTFEMSLESLWAPVGSTTNRIIGSDSLAKGPNAAVQALLNGEAPPKKFWFIDNDHEFDDVALMRLLQHDVPVVMALTMRKQPPFHLMGFTDTRTMWDEARKRVVPEFKNLSWEEIAAKPGLHEVKAVGRGGLLVDADVFRQIPPPWFTVGQIDPEELMEDVYFSELLNEHGIPMHVDTGDHEGAVGTGHISPVAVFAYRYGPESPYAMGVEMRWPNGKTIIVPMAMKPKKDEEAKDA